MVKRTTGIVFIVLLVKLIIVTILLFNVFGCAQ